MTNRKLSLAFHIVFQILAQAAVYALLKDHSPEAIYAAVVAVVGVVVAFLDVPTPPTAS